MASLSHVSLAWELGDKCDLCITGALKLYWMYIWIILHDIHCPVSML